MKKLLLFILLIITTMDMKCQTIPILFDRCISNPDYYVKMEIPIEHQPYGFSYFENWMHWFVYPDSSYIYWLRRGGINPNISRMEASIGDSLYKHLFKSNDLWFIRNDTLYSIICDGIDSEGLYWKNIIYIFPDSACCSIHNGESIVMLKMEYFRLTIGYARVTAEKKPIFDAALASFDIIVKDTLPSLPSYRVKDNFGKTSRFKYLRDTTGIFVNAPYLDMCLEHLQE